MLKLVPGSLESLVAVGVPSLLVLTLLALPFFDTRSRRNLRHRPLAMVALTGLLGGSALLFGAAARDNQPAEVAEIGRPLTSSERAGRALFSRQCAGCHLVAGLKVSEKKVRGKDDGPELTEIGTRHSSAWLHSFIEDPTRFHGDTVHMAAFGPPVLSHQEIEEVALYVGGLHGRPGANLKVDIKDTFPAPKKPK